MNVSGQHIKGLKQVLLSIGARDLRGDGIKESEFRELFDLMSKSWNDTNIFILPILKRKDILHSEVEEANRAILNASKGYQNITVLCSFNATIDMYWDEVHLNKHKEIPAIVKFLKISMSIVPAGQKQNSFRQTDSSQEYKP